MTNPTSNFGWQMPTNTDLVTDLPADFEVFGQAVDTSMADLKGGTTGQILSKTTNADMDFTWIANDQGDITSVTATSPLTGGGTSGAITVGIQDATTSVKGSVQLSDSTSTTSSVLAATPTAVKAAYDKASTAATTSVAGIVQLSDSTSTTSSVLASTPTATKSAYDLAAAAIPKSTATAKGNVFTATAASTPTVLAVGTNGQVLTADSTAGTGLAWATPTSGGMTLLSTTTLTGSSVTISSINQGYTNLYVQITGATFSVAGSCTLKINAVTDSFWVGGVEADNATPSLQVYGGNTALTIFKNTQTGCSHVMTFTVSNYADTTYHTVQGAYTAVGAAFKGGYYGGGWSPIAGGAAVTQVIIATTAGVFNAGSVKIYGVK